MAHKLALLAKVQFVSSQTSPDVVDIFLRSTFLLRIRFWLLSAKDSKPVLPSNTFRLMFCSSIQWTNIEKSIQICSHLSIGLLNSLIFFSKLIELWIVRTKFCVLCQIYVYLWTMILNRVMSWLTLTLLVSTTTSGKSWQHFQLISKLFLLNHLLLKYDLF